jgi:hypothetical protein
VNNLPSIIFLGIYPASILLTCPSHLIIWAFINFTVSSPFITLLNSSLSLISPNILLLDQPINLSQYFP